MTPEEYEAAFHGIDLPPTLNLAQGVTVNDVPAFLASQIHMLKNSTSPRVIELVKYRLDLAMMLMSGDK